MSSKTINDVLFHFHLALPFKTHVNYNCYNCSKICTQQYSTGLNMYRFPEFIYLFLYLGMLAFKSNASL